MRILISAVGTRGDVQPALALAVALRALGHQPRLGVPPNFTSWAEGMGFVAHPVGIAMRPPAPGTQPPPVPDLIADQFAKIAAAGHGCDLLVGCGAHQYALRSIAEARGLRCAQAVYAPVSLPSPELAPAGPAAPSDPAEIAELWSANRRGWNDRALDRVNAGRRALGLGPISDVLDHILGDAPWLAADPMLAPAPATVGRTVVQTGAWILPDAAPLPECVEAFLGAGSAPVYLGLGSMPADAALSRPLIEAVRALGRRAILSRGWAGLAPIDDAPDVLAVEELNHQALFGRVAAVVHHGGAGSTTAAALAGAPQVVTPLFSDQFYWGRRVEACGLGSALPAASLSAHGIAEALERALAPAVAERAWGLAGSVSTEGAATAAHWLIESCG